MVDRASTLIDGEWGDIMTVCAQRKGVAGTVIDGVCRDMPRILESKYSVFFRGHIPMTGKDRVEVDGVNIPVGLDDFLVKPGDLVACDGTGVVVVSSGKNR